jgi:DNA-binding transcriptional regulator GbsR (MarR family)
VSPDAHSRDLEAVREGFVELWGRMATFWGVSPSAARVLGWLIARAEPADAEELMAGLGASRGAISMACRELADWGLVHPVREAGSRKLVYRPETDLEKAVRSIVQTRKRREWDPILEKTREWIPRLSGRGSGDEAVFRRRLEEIEAVVGLADSMAESFLAGKIVPRIGLKALTAAARRKRAGQKRRAK